MKLRRRARALAALVLAAAWAAPARAQMAPGSLGVGGVLFDPTGFSAEYWADSRTAYDLSLGAKGGDFAMNADLLLRMKGALPDKGPVVPFYLGLGAGLAAHQPTELGVRFVAGLSYFAKQNPIELFAELVPVMRVAPRFGSDLDAAAGVRIYLGRR